MRYSKVTNTVHLMGERRIRSVSIGMLLLVISMLFFLTLFIHLDEEHYRTRSQAQAAIFEYIEIYYNRQRRNAAIGNIPLCEFRRRFYQQQAA